MREREHLIFRRHPIAGVMGGALYYPLGDRAVIVLDSRLDYAQRRCALAHELVHDERGGVLTGLPERLEVVTIREERRVHREVADRLVPAVDLAELVRVRGEVEPVTISIVMEEFSVTAEIALEAMQALAMRTGEQE